MWVEVMVQGLELVLWGLQVDEKECWWDLLKAVGLLRAVHLSKVS